MSASSYHITISNIEDNGLQLFNNNLILYCGKPMPSSVFEQKQKQLRYISISTSDADNTGKQSRNHSENTGKSSKTPTTIIGYIQSHPMMYSNVEYLAIEEIEIFEPYRKLKYGSKVIATLQQAQYPLLIIDIQEYALGFWLHILGSAYWNKLVDSDVESLITSCSYAGKVADYFRTTYSNK